MMTVMITVHDNSCPNARDSWNYYQLLWPFEQGTSRAFRILFYSIFTTLSRALSEFSFIRLLRMYLVHI